MARYTSSTVFASTRFWTRRLPLSVAKKPLNRPTSIVSPTKPISSAAALANFAYSSAGSFDGRIFAPSRPARRTTSAAAFAPLDASGASDTAFARPVTPLAPGTVGTARATTASMKPDTRLNDIEPSGVNSEANPRPGVWACSPPAVPRYCRARRPWLTFASPPTRNPEPAFSSSMMSVPTSVDANQPLTPGWSSKNCATPPCTIS